MPYRLSRKYKNKRAFITGAGSGLGRALAVALAEDMWTIGLADIRKKGLTESAKLVRHSGGKAFIYQFDVSKKEDYQTAFDDYVSKVGGIDLLINNAGVGDSALFGDYELENWDWITGINQLAVVYGSHFASRVMKKQCSGHIISIASAAGYVNMPNMSMYNVTKAAVISLMETLYTELKGSGINVSVACPTFFQSNIMQNRKGDSETGSIADRIVHKAKYSADDIARIILVEAGKETFLILPSYQVKIALHLKNLFPGWFLRYKANKFSGPDGREWLTRLMEL